MDFTQRNFYQYWKEEWKRRNPVQADLSYIFTYIYELLENAVRDEKNLYSYISELNALKDCYPGKIDLYVSTWITDLLDYNKNYAAVYERLVTDVDTWDSLWEINRLLNLKIILGKPMDGKDFLYLGKKLGVNLYKSTIGHINEAIEMAHQYLLQFEQEKGIPFLRYIEEKYDYENRHQELIFSGVPTSHLYYVPYTTFRFYGISFVVEFITDKVIEINHTLKEKYSKSKKIISKRPYINLWHLKVHEPFKNPTLVKDNSGCKHEYLQLQNHWETFRKYECIKCHKIFMCSCDRELAEQVRPYQIKGTWLDGICPKCRGLDDTSPVNSGQRMYGSTFYAQHWREIDMEGMKIEIELKRRNSLNNTDSIDKLMYAKPNEAENRVRARYGVPPIGEAWVSETVLFKNLKKIFPDYEVIHHARPGWLGKQHLDIYIPQKKIAFEFQGIQHDKSVEFFGGVEGLEKRKELDIKKEKLCKENNIKLIYIYDGEDYSIDSLKKRLENYTD
ncbi:MAG: TerB N-terminal domain-containing protein [Candidatus Delongbacteria bacterium]|nr:TerB N-terminal domain-containing protein [Candidatus Delongbacteria bacterium]